MYVFFAWNAQQCVQTKHNGTSAFHRLRVRRGISLDKQIVCFFSIGWSDFRDAFHAVICCVIGLKWMNTMHTSY